MELSQLFLNEAAHQRPTGASNHRKMITRREWAHYWSARRICQALRF